MEEDLERGIRAVPKSRVSGHGVFAHAALLGLALVAPALAGCAMKTPKLNSDSDLAECAKRLASPSVPVDVLFSNAGGREAGLWWVRSDASLQFYRSLRPGKSVVQPSFVGHLWVAARGGEVAQLHCVGEASAKVVIE